MSHEAVRGQDADHPTDEHTDEPADERDDEEEGGAVSEVANLGDGGPIDPDQAVGASPDPEVQEGKQGPNARTGNHAPGN